MKHQYQSNYKQNEFLDVVGTYENGNLKCQVTTYSPRGKRRSKWCPFGSPHWKVSGQTTTL